VYGKQERVLIVYFFFLPDFFVKRRRSSDSRPLKSPLSFPSEALWKGLRWSEALLLKTFSSSVVPPSTDTDATN
jgi:hypothetical protein